MLHFKSIRLALVSTVALAATSFAQTTFNWTGGVDGTSNILLGTSGFDNWSPVLTADDYALDSVNIFRIASRVNGGPDDRIGADGPLFLDASNYFGKLVIDNPDGYLPDTLSILANSTGTTARVFRFLEPNTTILELTDNVTGTVSFGNGATNGRLAFRLGESGISTIHVANADAVLNFSGMEDNVLGRGAISAGGTTQSATDHATLRYTGAGTIDLRTGDGQGMRVLGTIIEGARVIVSSSLQLGWTPVDFKEDAIVINGGILEFANTSFITSAASRGVQLGDNGGTVRLLNNNLRIAGVSSDITGQNGSLTIEANNFIFAFAGGSHTGGTNLQSGQLVLIDDGTLGGSGSLAGLNVAADAKFRGSGTVHGHSFFANGTEIRPDVMPSTLNPSNVIGTLAFANNLTLGSVSLVIDLAANDASDLITVGGILDIGTGLLDLTSFVFTDLLGFDAGLYVLIQASSPIVGTLGATTVGTVGGFDVELAFNNAGDAINLLVIPEPSAYAALAGLFALGLATLRRRR